MDLNVKYVSVWPKMKKFILAMQNLVTSATSTWRVPKAELNLLLVLSKLPILEMRDAFIFGKKIKMRAFFFRKNLKDEGFFSSKYLLQRMY